MTRGTRDYSKGKIYRLVHGEITVYIGSSGTTLSKRMCKHRSSARKGKTYNIYKYMREVGLENIRIVLIELWPCQSKEELVQREQHWIEHCDFPNVDLKNTKRAYCTIENKRLDHNVRSQRYKKTVKGEATKMRYYKSENGLAAAQRKREPFVCTCGCTVVFTNRFRHRRTEKHNKLIRRKAAELIAFLILGASLAATQNMTAQIPAE